MSKIIVALVFMSCYAFLQPGVQAPNPDCILCTRDNLSVNMTCDETEGNTILSYCRDTGNCNPGVLECVPDI